MEFFIMIFLILIMINIEKMWKQEKKRIKEWKELNQII